MNEVLIALAVASWLASPPKSLADVAAREAVRRKATPIATVVLKGDDRWTMPAADAPTAHGVQLPDEDEAGNALPAPGPAAANPAASGEIRTEQWWRQESQRLRAAIDTGRMLGEAMQSRINALRIDLVNRDSPTQQSDLRAQLDRALASLEQLRAQSAAAEKHYAAFVDEARRQGAPPGWIR